MTASLMALRGFLFGLALPVFLHELAAISLQVKK